MEIAAGLFSAYPPRHQVPSGVQSASGHVVDEFNEPASTSHNCPGMPAPQADECDQLTRVPPGLVVLEISALPRELHPFTWYQFLSKGNRAAAR